MTKASRTIYGIVRYLDPPPGKVHGRVEYLHFGAQIIETDDGFAVKPARYHWKKERNGRLRFVRRAQAAVAVEMAAAQGCDILGAVVEPFTARQEPEGRSQDKANDRDRRAERKQRAIESADSPPPSGRQAGMSVNPEYL